METHLLISDSLQDTVQNDDIYIFFFFFITMHVCAKYLEMCFIFSYIQVFKPYS